MKWIIALILCACVASFNTLAHEAPDRCERLEQERERIYAQLRKSHSAATARRLKARLLELHSIIAHQCR